MMMGDVYYTFAQSHLLSMCISFAPCVTGVLVLDLT
jgi:hypothetical protein